MTLTSAETWMAAINAELKRLKADTDFNAYSGLSVELKEGEIQIFDDYDRATLPNPDATLAQLKEIQSIDWEETAFEPIWNIITATGGY